MAHRAPRAPHGFTLIEVLVALAIVAIGMAAVLGALGSAASSTAYLRDRTYAEWIGLNHLAEVRLRGTPPATGKTDGDLDYADRKWHWRQEVEATQVQGMVRIDVKVRPAEIKGDEDRNWYATVTGIAGDSIAPPRDLPGTWDKPGIGPVLPNGQPLPNGGFSSSGVNSTLGSDPDSGLGGNSGQLGSDLPPSPPTDSGPRPEPPPPDSLQP